MLRATILPLGLLLLLAPACGGKDDNDDDGGTGGTGATGTPDGTTAAAATTADDMVTTQGPSEPMTGTTMPGETGDMTTTEDPTTGGGSMGCANYCTTISTNCPGEETQYGGVEFCMGACAAFPAGTPADMAGNTLGCRTYHAGAAMMDPVVHCTHAGPGGAGVCGSNCDGFCAISVAACPEVWADTAACMTACTGFADAEKYDASDIGGDTLACRLYHATAATVDPGVHCAHIKADSAPCK